MSTTPTNDGGPAFPHPELVQDILDDKGHLKGSRVYHAQTGMSLRAYFSAHALAGYNANSDVDHEGRATSAAKAQWSVEDADALIAELAKKPSVD